MWKMRERETDMGMLAATAASRAISPFSRGAKVLGERILIVEDEKETRGMLRDYLENKGYEIATAETCALTEEIWRTSRPDIAILDYSLSDGNALGLVPRLKAIDASVPIIVLTGYGSIDLAVEAVKLGAELFLPKPAELSTLYLLIQRSLENRRNRRQQLAERIRSGRGILDPFLGKSDGVRRLAELAHNLALNDTPVLIRGEAGTGKGSMAMWLHHNGSRAAEFFVDLNCGEFPGNLLEVELFALAHESLVGVSQNQASLLEIAHKGTVFLDEIESMDPQIQPKLLKVMDEKLFRKLGEVCDRRVDVRFIAATQHVTAPQVLRRSRDDQHFRISWNSLSLPPLRERIEDVPILSAHILRELATDLGIGNLELGGVALRALQSYSWPGNIRELRNVLERVVLVAGNDVSADQDVRFDVLVDQYVSGIGRFGTLEEMERDYIQQVLRKEHGRVQSAARKLGIPRSSLYHKLKQYKAERSGLQPAS
jgi:DNA-binding NtrC family response regulator